MRPAGVSANPPRSDPESRTLYIMYLYLIHLEVVLIWCGRGELGASARPGGGCGIQRNREVRVL